MISIYSLFCFASFDILALYRVSYLYITLIGTLTTIIVALLVSFATGCDIAEIKFVGHLISRVFLLAFRSELSARRRPSHDHQLRRPLLLLSVAAQAAEVLVRRAVRPDCGRQARWRR